MANGTYEPLGIGAGSLIAGRYELIKRLGAGAMSVVYQAVDRSLDREQLALKLLAPHLINDERQLQRFRNEVLISRKLTHPNIVRTFEFGQAEKPHYFITMELVDGVTLADLVGTPGSQGLSLEEAVKILHDTCIGVGYAHSMGVVHRDLKPANVLITMDSQVKLTDFGLAQTGEVNKRLTMTGECVGTPLYMAPEQIQDREVDLRTDIYALGVMAYQLVSGALPFFQESWFDLANEIVNTPFPELPSQKSKIPEWYCTFVKKATEKEKSNRYQSVEEILSVLQEHVSFDQGRALPITLSTTQPQAAQKKKESGKFSETLFRAAPFIFVLSIVTLVGVIFIALTQTAANKVSQEVERSKPAISETINEFSDTLNKLHEAVTKVHRDKDRIDTYLEEQQPSGPLGPMKVEGEFPSPQAPLGPQSR